MKESKRIANGNTMKALGTLVILGALCGGCASKQTEEDLVKTQNNVSEMGHRVATIEGRVQVLDQEVDATQGQVYDVYSRNGKKTGMTARPVPTAQNKPVVYSSPQSNITTPAPYPSAAKPTAAKPVQTKANPVATKPVATANTANTGTAAKAPLGTLDPNSKMPLNSSAQPVNAGAANTNDLSELSLPPETAMYIPTGAAQSPSTTASYDGGAALVAPAVQPAQPVTPVVAPAVAKPAAKPAPAMSGEKAAYNTALNLVRSGQSTAGRDKFIAFLQAYPHSSLVPNAHYWIGESYYSQGNYTDALFAFKQVTTNFPKHHKTSDALLKAGLTYQKLGDTANAQTQYRALLVDFPKSNAAKIVRSRKL